MDARPAPFFLPLATLLLLAGCTRSERPVPYLEGRCADPGRPCSLSYDFEPSGAALDPFTPAAEGPRFLLVNEDGALFRWNLGPKSEWDQDHAQLVRLLGEQIHKLESLASGTCNGTPVVLAAANFMPGRKGRSEPRERVVAIAGRLEAPVRVLQRASEALRAIAAKEGAALAKIEGLALSRDCRTLYAGVRSVTAQEGGDEQVRDAIYPVALDVDWAGEREDAVLGKALHLGAERGCSGEPEGISSLEVLSDGTFLATTSFERETTARRTPQEIGRAELSGTLWRLRPGAARAERLACFPGHKPEALAVWPDEKSARVVFEDDDYGGRPIGAYAVEVPLP